ncbi:T9SS type A sorting domain-containing protein [Chryseobacterium sp. FH1]|uniref:T9SS type A sorting domain-containing protein n=1 Tax=Chryseobacterium sp. FH1 TaxID=1233951 RepID=UPI0004E2ECB1|nr:T9SS type A sorting domain-containing protein [Chryseobacterium sp. FH1]KFC24318.1 hypothetical protein IO90_03180 [Chryseobacterium sp. FH1]
MKKIYFLAASLLALSTINAQERLSAVSSSISIAASEKNPAAILYAQPIVGTSGIVSDQLSNGNFVVAADDFTLTQAANASKINIVGFQNQGNLNTLCTGVVLYIYTDNAGKPSGIPGDANPFVARVNVSAPSTVYSIASPSTGSFTFTVDLEAATGGAVALQANTKYWLVFAPKVNLTAYTAATRWNWYTGSILGTKAKLVDPQNAFGAGATNWTDISALTADASFDGLAFSIEGQTVLGTGEVYSSIKDLSVAQSNDQLFIFAKNQKVLSSVLFSSDGKKVLSGTGDKVNISVLPKGAYVINVTTADGKTTSTKFIKK